jgi:arylsulfatase A-like enzyme
MNNKLIVALIVGGCTVAAPCLKAQTAVGSNRPNVILCMTDDQGWGDVSYNGLKKIRTPTLDAMAAAGIRFNRFYAQQSCSPTRASVMMGRHPLCPDGLHGFGRLDRIGQRHTRV